MREDRKREGKNKRIKRNRTTKVRNGEGERKEILKGRKSGNEKKEERRKRQDTHIQRN